MSWSHRENSLGCLHSPGVLPVSILCPGDTAALRWQWGGLSLCLCRMGSKESSIETE